MSGQVNQISESRKINQFSRETCRGGKAISDSISQGSDDIERSADGGLARVEQRGGKDESDGVGVQLEHVLVSSLHAVERVAARLLGGLVDLAVLEKHGPVGVEVGQRDLEEAAGTVDQAAEHLADDEIGNDEDEGIGVVPGELEGESGNH